MNALVEANGFLVVYYFEIRIVQVDFTVIVSVYMVQSGLSSLKGGNQETFKNEPSLFRATGFSNHVFLSPIHLHPTKAGKIICFPDNRSYEGRNVLNAL